MPSGPGSRASHRAPASRVSALAGFDPYRGRTASLAPHLPRALSSGARSAAIALASARSRPP